MKRLIISVFALSLVTACTTPGTKTAIGAGVGAAVGAGAGAVIAKSTGGKAGQGAVYGALAGVATGGLIGNYYDKQAKELAKIASVVKTDDGIEVTLKNDILFATDSAVLSTPAKQTLTDLNKVLKKYPENIIVIQGHTDATGNAPCNKNLSTSRAKAVYNFIVDNGLKTNSLKYIGYGDTAPLFDNKTADNRAKNRRVELKITANKQLLENNIK